MTIKKEDLQKFCLNDPERKYLNQPFSNCGTTYAMNGFVIVRVNGKLAEPNLTAQSRIKHLPWDYLYECYRQECHKSESIIIDNSGYLSKRLDHTCKTCTPGAPADNTCKECDGEGLITFDSIKNSYEVECKTCYGDGFVGPISPENCQCRGTKWAHRSTFKYWDCVYLAANLVGGVVDTFNDVRLFKPIRNKGWGDSVLNLGPVPFISREADGLIMPKLYNYSDVVVNKDMECVPG